jgi:hypothetical protein
VADLDGKVFVAFGAFQTAKSQILLHTFWLIEWSNLWPLLGNARTLGPRPNKAEKGLMNGPKAITIGVAMNVARSRSG